MLGAQQRSRCQRPELGDDRRNRAAARAAPQSRTDPDLHGRWRLDGQQYPGLPRTRRPVPDEPAGILRSVPGERGRAQELLAHEVRRLPRVRRRASELGAPRDRRAGTAAARRERRDPEHRRLAPRRGYFEGAADRAPRHEPRGRVHRVRRARASGASDRRVRAQRRASALCLVRWPAETRGYHVRPAAPRRGPRAGGARRAGRGSRALARVVAGRATRGGHPAARGATRRALRDHQPGRDTARPRGPACASTPTCHRRCPRRSRAGSAWKRALGLRPRFDGAGGAWFPFRQWT